MSDEGLKKVSNEGLKKGIEKVNVREPVNPIV